MSRVDIKKLRELLGFSSSFRFNAWYTSYLETVWEEGKEYVECAVFDSWLAEKDRCQGFPEPLTIQQLLSGEVRLVIPAHVQKLLVPGAECTPIHYSRLYKDLLKRGAVAGISLKANMWRLSLGSVEGFVAERERAAREALTQAQVSHILGFHLNVVYRLMRAGTLQAHTFRLHSPLVTRRSLEGFLATHCHFLGMQYTNPQSWIEARLNSLLPLVAKKEACEALDMTPDELDHFVNRGGLEGIRTPGKYSFTPESVKRSMFNRALGL